MRIDRSDVALASQRQATTTESTKGTFEAWVGERRPGTARSLVAAGTGQAAISAISSQAQLAARTAAAAAARETTRRDALNQLRSLASAAQSQAAASASGASSSDLDPSDPTLSDPNLVALIQLIERLTGQKVHLYHPSQTQPTTSAPAAAQSAPAPTAPSAPAASAGWGVAVHVEQVHHETETTAFQASGTVQTADGRSVAFDFGVSMHRDETQTATLDIRAGDAEVDPIALNLDGGPVSLVDQRAAFDLNTDGATEQIALPGAGSYFLALDRNGNGTIDTGSELFGPQTGNGFAELRTLDQDGNGWIDEGDAAFGSLRLWTAPDAATTTLKDAGVGALYIGANVATSFDLNSGTGASLGQVRTSSVYLKEDGTPGALAQVDLTA